MGWFSTVAVAPGVGDGAGVTVGTATAVGELQLATAAAMPSAINARRKRAACHLVNIIVSIRSCDAPMRPGGRPPAPTLVRTRARPRPADPGQAGPAPACSGNGYDCAGPAPPRTPGTWAA